MQQNTKTSFKNNSRIREIIYLVSVERFLILSWRHSSLIFWPSDGLICLKHTSPEFRPCILFSVNQDLLNPIFKHTKMLLSTVIWLSFPFLKSRVKDKRQNVLESQLSYKFQLSGSHFTVNQVRTWKNLKLLDWAEGWA